MPSLEDLMSTSATPTLDTHTELDTMTEAKTPTAAEIKFTPEEEKKIAELAKKIDARATDMVGSYGVTAQSGVAGFADQVLKDVKTKDTGDVGEIVTDLLQDLRNTDLTKENAGVLGRLFGRAKNSIQRKMDTYQSMESRINVVTGKLQSAKQDMSRNDIILGKLYDDNMAHYRELCLYIEAGERFVKEETQVNIPKLQQEAMAEGTDETRAMKLMAIETYTSNVERFERRLNDLKISKTIAVQTAPQINVIRESGRQLSDKITSLITLTVPLWKRQMVMALGLEDQRKAVGVATAVTDTTNELMKRTSQKTHDLSIEIAKQNQRSIVDMETLETAQSNLIDTLQQTTQIQKEGRERRRAAEIRLAELESELGKKLRETIDQRQENLLT